MPTYTFGAQKLTGDMADWLVQNASKNNQAQEALALDEKGEPVVAHYYQRVSEMTLEVIIPSGTTTLPQIGTTIQYNGDYWYISAVSITETNTDFVRYSLTCKRFLKHGLPDHQIDESDSDF